MRRHYQAFFIIRYYIDIFARFVYNNNMQSTPRTKGGMPDFEDAVVDAVAERNGADYILTRNIKDFAGSSVPAVTPTEFLAK